MSQRLSPSFRYDINGLRAWAVLAVLFYHFSIPGFSGGFAGVDVFFVISGFLMTGIIAQSKQASSFSLLAFYLARLRRIVPPLLVLCACLLLFGFVYLGSVDYKAMSVHVATALLFISNITFWFEAGYFDVLAHEKWLLHTWSLAVEWQFYMLLPLLMMLFYCKQSPRLYWLCGFVAMLLASFIFATVLLEWNPSAAFYLLPSRAWEMLAGGVVYFIGRQAISPNILRIIEFGGFLAILIAIVFIDSTFPWPGFYALLPVLGSAAIIFTARNDSILTNNRLCQWFGDRSYSLYLWHWPVVVGLAYWQLASHPYWILAGIVLSILLAHLSFVFIEQRSKYWFAAYSRHMAVILFLLTILFVAAIAHMISIHSGLPARLPENIVQAENAAFDKDPRFHECHVLKGKDFTSCQYGSNITKAIVLGDSHVSAVVTAIEKALPQGTGLLAMSYSTCPTIKDAKVSHLLINRCADFNEWAIQHIDKLSKDIPLVIVNRTTAAALGRGEDGKRAQGVPLVYFDKPVKLADSRFIDDFSRRLVETACEFARSRTVYLMRPLPEMPLDVPRYYSRSLLNNMHLNIAVSLEDYHKRHHWVWAAQDEAAARCGVKILNPLPYLCDEKQCGGVRDGRPVYYDEDHLSEYGNQFLLPMFRSIFIQK